MESFAHMDSPRSARILEAAHRMLFSLGVQATTMEVLAKELGMSKKTLYQHFSGKEQMMEAIVDHLSEALHAKMESVFSEVGLNCTERLCRVADIIGSQMARLSPTLLADLKRNAPAIYAKIDGVRRRNIPKFFGRIIRDGIAEGSIRMEVNPDFACEFWLQALRGMMDPETLEKTGLSPKETLQASLSLFFQGLLTPEGREQFHTHRTRCELHKGGH